MCYDSVLKYLMRDFISLRQYINALCYNGDNIIDIDDLKRRLFIIQRNINTNIPDHYYNKFNENIFSRLSSIADIFTIGIPEFAHKYLELDKEDLVCVKENCFIEWQNTIPIISPLLLISSFIANDIAFEENFKIDCDSIPEFFHRAIIPNTKNTALVGPNIINLKNFFSEKGGVSDLHIHLNGILEADAVWQDLLSNTDQYVSHLNSQRDKSSFKQALEQIGYFEAKDIFSNLLDRAKHIRIEFRDLIIDSISKDHTVNQKTDYSIEQRISSRNTHPFCIFFDNNPNISIPNSLLSYESLMYVLVIIYIKQLSLAEKRRKKNNKTNYIETYQSVSSEYVASLFHEYLLINGFFSSLCVQNMEENGFEQFQLKTQNTVYRLTDDKYLSKLLQLSGNKNANFKFIELRIVPSESSEGDSLKTYLTKIANGWKEFIKTANIDANSDYRLVAHFLKSSDKKPNNNISFFKLRKVIKEQTDNLISLKKSPDENSKKLNAIDAAASEFATPPEIFAPYYIKLRKAGYKNFTYHAGEDFYHVLSGLRAMYEAVEFCDLRKGDRIGHGSAAGIPIQEWINIIGDEISIPFGEYTDDLLFCYDFIIQRKIDSLIPLLVNIERRVLNNYFEIFEKSYNIQEILIAWKARRLEVDLTKTNIFKLEQSNKDIKMSNNIMTLLRNYNNKNFRNKYNKSIRIPIEDIFDVEQLLLLQKEFLKFLHEKEIVIETLPTSNIRIGYHRTFDTYQLFNWYNWYKEGYPLPPIVIGTDDPGIFQTNIYNEYAIIYCYLVYNKHQERNDVMRFIEDLYKNGELYKFDK